MKIRILVFSIFLILAFTAQQDDPQSTEQLTTAATQNEQQPSNFSLKETWDQNIVKVESFDQLYELIHSHLAERIQQLNSQYNQQSSVCQNISETLNKFQNDVTRISGFIEYVQGKINKDQAQIDGIYDDRCKAHLQYLNYMKNSRTTVRLLEFLRAAIVNYNFVQLRSVGKILTKYMYNDFANKEVLNLMLAELKQVDADAGKYLSGTDSSLKNKEKSRTADEVGSKHIDQGRENLTLQNFHSGDRHSLDQQKADIVNIIDQLINNTRSEIERRQNDEIELNNKVIDWTDRIQREINVLQTELNSQSAALNETQKEIEAVNFDLDTCKSDKQWIADQKDTLTQYQAQFEENKSDYQKKYEEDRNNIYKSSHLTVDAASNSTQSSNETSTSNSSTDVSKPKKFSVSQAPQEEANVTTTNTTTETQSGPL